MSRSIQYTSSPLLASRTPVWRSKFVVAMIALGFTGLGARAAYIGAIAKTGQIVGHAGRRPRQKMGR